MPAYNKLVRDKIPEIIEQGGRKCSMAVLDEEEYEQELRRKLQEEVQEYLEARNVEELVDIMEVVFALGKVHGATEDTLMGVREKKRNERGGFEKRIYLKNVEGHKES